jgi:MFS family permease
MEETLEIAKKRKNNMKLYPIYTMVGFDLMFYYGIKILFLSQVKNIDVSYIVLSEAFYALFYIILQIPINAIMEKIGEKSSIVVGNVFNLIYIILILCSSNFYSLIIAELINSIASGFKIISETGILDNSIPKTENKGKIFSKIDSKGYSYYCYFYAVSTLLSGFLYDINPYIPITMCLVCIVCAIGLSLMYEEVEEEKNNKNSKTIMQNFNEIKIGFKFIFKSKRLKSLLIMIGFLWGVIALLSTYEVTLLEEMNISATYIGIILFCTQIIRGFASKRENKFNEKFKNKSLTIIALSITVCMIIAGIVSLANIPFVLQIGIIIFTYIVRTSVRGIYMIIKKRYMGNFANNEILSKIYSANSIIENLFKMIICLIGSFALNYMNIKYAMIFIGIIFTAVAILISRYSKTRLGLKPDKYPKEDIEFKIVR